ncbi:MAG: acetate--CoA ligase family protein [Gemmatimonadota bacterium]
MATDKLSPVFKARALEDAQARARASRPLQTLFTPRGVAVVGASERPDSVGRAVLENLRRSGFTGTLHPVNPKRDTVLGLACAPSLRQIDGPVDLAVVAIPAPAVAEVIDQCGEKGIGSAIVLTAGFKETGPEGARREGELVERARRAGVAVLGPNCLGLINTDPAFSLNASFARAMPAAGTIAFMSQSGALCTSILDYARAQRIGFSKFISFGNKADIDEADLLRYLAEDPQTQVILMYLEDLDDGLRFIHLAREVTGASGSGKPILAIKTGRTAEGASAAASHTGSLAGTDEVYDAIMAQAGVLRVETVQELFELAMAFGSQPMPAGNRVAIVTNAGGPGIMATDACVRQGLRLAEFTPATRQIMAAALPASASTHNPVDLIGDARHNRYRVALDAVLADEGTDAAIVILTPQTMTDIEEIARLVVAAGQGTRKPVIASFMGGVDVAAGIDILRSSGIPHYPFPENAARVLSAMVRYRSWVSRPRTRERIFEVDRGRAHKVLDQALRAGRDRLIEPEAHEVLAAYGLPVLPSGLARQRSEVAEICARLSFPVVLKIASPDILHKTEVGGVVVDVPDLAAAQATYDRLMADVARQRPQADLWGVFIQEMAPRGRELILGAVRDPKFGPLVMFGLGGIYTEALGDVVFRLAPFPSLSARHMLEEIRGRRILEGFRGEPPVDHEALQECLERLAQLVVEFPVIKELDMNPVIAYPKGAAAVDARIVMDLQKE